MSEEQDDRLKALRNLLTYDILKEFELLSEWNGEEYVELAMTNKKVHDDEATRSKCKEITEMIADLPVSERMRLGCIILGKCFGELKTDLIQKEGGNVEFNMCNLVWVTENDPVMIRVDGVGEELDKYIAGLPSVRTLRKGKEN